MNSASGPSSMNKSREASLKSHLEKQLTIAYYFITSITHLIEFKMSTLLMTWDALDHGLIMASTYRSSYSGIKWLQFRCCILKREDNLDMGETIKKRFWMTWNIINEKLYFPVAQLDLSYYVLWFQKILRPDLDFKYLWFIKRRDIKRL